MTQSWLFVLIAAISLCAVPLRAQEQKRAGCIAVATPTVQGMTGKAADPANAVRDLLVSYLAGAPFQVMTLEAKLPSLASGEARQKGCETILFLNLTRKAGGGGLARAMGQAAGSTSWRVPYGGSSAASTAAHTGAAGGLQAISTMAQSTKAKDEVRLEYRLETTGGQVQFGPRAEQRKANADGEDLLTPLVAKAAEAIVSRKVSK